MAQTDSDIILWLLCLHTKGQYVKKDCFTNLQKGECELCPDGTYTNQWNSQRSCELCTSCTQPNANLEEAEPCTRGRDRKCRCKKDHYCDSGTGTCTLCQPCTKCGTAGVKVPCTVNSDTVCNEQTEGMVSLIKFMMANQYRSNSWLSCFGCTHCCCWSCWVLYLEETSKQVSLPLLYITGPAEGTTTSCELQSLTVQDVDLLPYLSDIARETGWTVIQDIARRSNISPGYY
ncbi:hypothetical protein L3Q82_011905 [Scortum barcoo]|uniref:Uncharacterized protein n=1 Tax=Scortum barcoo TaxID=214431 RepID=A0ACB8W7R9_9TELE|nr:hypothetical protein L3Q82_011905 [Scortum barcoo]